VENHGGHSSDGSWLSNVIRSVKMPNIGTLPDFGNFNITAHRLTLLAVITALVSFA